MKKISLFFALFLVLGLGKSFAGYLNVINMTNCPFQFYSGIGSIVSGSTTYQFTFGTVNINPGSNFFANPTLLTGFATNAPASAQASGCVEITKVNGPGGAAFPIGKMAPYTTYASTNNPTCNAGNNYTMTWNTGSNNCDAVILIF
ncbi:hypothetical protein [Taibaiella chishuiensis]|uniref:Uncharacterized protein n=1 Tax=Taibaiella chishuiensis TaxID=1434707 RepID=A0A2P8D0L7_9BACT|nr:hypothetical protein [Taibaiella chishuiensis]PSK90758.1 hypothetical protein B0I18_107169 [Taibaiella chishuiensis]